MVGGKATNDDRHLFMRKIACILFVVLLLGAPLAGWPQHVVMGATSEVIFLPNAGFEEVENGKPLKWSPLAPSDVYESTTEEVYEGVYSVKLEDPSDNANPGLRSERIAVEPGEQYRASAYSFNVSGVSDLYLEFWNSDHERIGVTFETNNIPNEWASMETLGVAPEGTVYATILLYLPKVNIGVAYFDSISLEMIPAVVYPETLLNAGFEEVTEDKPDAWTPLNPDVRYESSTEEVLQGTYSVELSDPSDDAGAGLRSSPIAVTPGTDYEASVYSYNQSGSSQLYLEFWNHTNERIATMIQSNSNQGEWSEITVQDYAPEGAVYATLLLYLHKSNIGTAYFDNVSFAVAPEGPVREFPLLVDGHPRLYFTESDVQMLRAKAEDTTGNPFGKTGEAIWSEVEQTARGYLDEDSFTASYYGGYMVTYPLPPQQPERMDNPPGFVGGVYPYWTLMSRQIQQRLETLSLAYIVTEEAAFAKRAKDYVLALTTWDTWTDPYYSCGGSTCLDTAHLTLGVSMAYDSLYDWFSEEERSRVESALIHKGLNPLSRDVRQKTDHNIQMLRASALGSGGALLLGKDDNAHQYLTRATEYFEWYLDERMASGHQEGLMYTSYSLDNLMRSIDQIARTTGERDLIEHPFIDDFVVRWVNYFLAPGGGGLANFSDSSTSHYYFVTMNIINSWLDNGQAGWYLAETKPSAEPLERFIYFNPEATIENPGDTWPTSTILDEIGWVGLRSGWESDDTLLAFVSNNSQMGHNHYDQNSFQIATNGSWIAGDPGYVDYGPNRYFTENFGHSTIHVDGEGQSRKGGGHLAERFLAPTYDYVVGSAADAYVEPSLERFDRHVVYVKPHYYVLLDDLIANEPRTFEWMLFNGGLSSFEIDGQGAIPGQVTDGDHLYFENGYAQLAAKFLSPEKLPIIIDQYPGAESYGYFTKVSSGDKKDAHRFLTVMEAAPVNNEGVYRAVDLLPPEDTSGQEYKTVTAAGTNLVFYRGEAAEDYMTLSLNVEEAGEYTLSSHFIQSPLYGQVQVYVDGQPLGGVYDGYNETVQAAEPFEHGKIDLSAGEHAIRYEVVGKNAESGNYFIGLEAIKLVPTEAEEGEGEGAKVEVDAELIQNAHAIGAKVFRGDASFTTDLVVFKTGEAPYSLHGVESDGDQVVVSYNENDTVEQYNMTNGTMLKYDGRVLLQGEQPLNIAMSYEAGKAVLKGSVEVDEAMPVTLFANSPQRIMVNGNQIDKRDYAYDEEKRLLTIHLSEGAHHIVIEEQAVTIPIMLDTLDDYREEISSDEAYHALEIHLTAVGRFEKKEAADKIVKHMEGFKLLLGHQKESGLISEDAYNALKMKANSLIKRWQ